MHKRHPEHVKDKFKFFVSGWLVVNCVFNLSRVFGCKKKEGWKGILLRTFAAVAATHQE